VTIRAGAVRKNRCGKGEQRSLDGIRLPHCQHANLIDAPRRIPNIGDTYSYSSQSKFPVGFPVRRRFGDQAPRRLSVDVSISSKDIDLFNFFGVDVASIEYFQFANFPTGAAELKSRKWRR
jgi:hypothetical protein